MAETVELKKNLPPPAETKPEEKGLSDDACVSCDLPAPTSSSPG